MTTDEEDNNEADSKKGLLSNPNVANGDVKGEKSYSNNNIKDEAGRKQASQAPQSGSGPLTKCAKKEEEVVDNKAQGQKVEKMDVDENKDEVKMDNIRSTRSTRMMDL